jgi:hypothetical protein
MVHEQPGVFTVMFGGNAQVPSWRAVLRQDDAGNISELYIPAESTRELSARDYQWPLTCIGSSNSAGVEGTMSRGRENYANFPVATFEMIKKSPEAIVIHAAGPSKNKHFEQDRTYTFTAKGVAIEASILPLIALNGLGFSQHWDREQLADVTNNAIRIRKQGRDGWILLPSSGQDGSHPLHWTATYPNEIEFMLRRPTPTFVRLFVDKNFEAAEGKNLFGHNDKDYFHAADHRLLYEKMTDVSSGSVAAGEKQTYKVRFEFEARPAAGY